VVFVFTDATCSNVSPPSSCTSPPFIVAVDSVKSGRSDVSGSRDGLAVAQPMIPAVTNPPTERARVDPAREAEPILGKDGSTMA